VQEATLVPVVLQPQEVAVLEPVLVRVLEQEQAVLEQEQAVLEQEQALVKGVPPA
jgi:hypothetical protein